MSEHHDKEPATADLLRLVAQGDKAATMRVFGKKYDALIRGVREVLYRFPSLLMRNVEPESILHAALPEMARALEQKQPPTWDDVERLVREIIRHNLIDLVRKLNKQRNREVPLKSLGDADIPADAGPQSAPSAPALYRELQAKVEALPERLLAVGRAWLQRRKTKEIAAEQGVSTSLIRRKLRLVRELLGVKKRTRKEADQPAEAAPPAAQAPAAAPASAKSSLDHADSGNSLGESHLSLVDPQTPAFGPDLAPGTELYPGIELVRPLKNGGCGSVWEASLNGNPLAVKLVPYGKKGALEATILGGERLRHGNLVQGFQICTKLSWFVFVMDFGHESLRDRLNKAGEGNGLPLPDVLTYLGSAAQGIDYLNSVRRRNPEISQVIHRDIKPDNLLVFGSSVKVCDFGLAVSLAGEVEQKGTGRTWQYAPPEFYDGRTARTSDQFALAVTYCELRGGRRPFSEEGQVLTAAPDLGMLSPVEKPIVARALAPDYRDRLSSCTEFIELLRKATGITRRAVVKRADDRSRCYVWDALKSNLHWYAKMNHYFAKGELVGLVVAPGFMLGSKINPAD